MSFHYHQGKANVVVDSLSKLSMGSTAHIDDGKKKLVKYVDRLSKLGVRFMGYISVGVSVHPSSKSSLVVEVNKGQHFDPVLLS